MRDRGLAILTAILIASAALAAGPASAEHRICNAPLSDWQPREALLSKLKAEGWQSIMLRIDDGCYKVRASKADGDQLDAKFDPATLTIVSRRGGGHSEHRRGPHDDD